MKKFIGALLFVCVLIFYGGCKPMKSLEGKDATGELDTISGATVSSGPVVNGIHEAAKLVDKLK